MQPRSRQLFRDYGLTLALLLVAGLLWWRTMTPALKRAAALDDEKTRQQQEQQQVEEQILRLRAAEAGKDDPESIERVAREQNGAAGLPSNEVIVRPKPGEEAARDD
jgi:cell division protein FtsL